MQNHQLWYTRRGNEVRGPFPAPQITRFILLGRIHDSDELSIDQSDWQKVSEVPVLIPQELKSNLSDPEAHQRLLMARMREDERSARDRRDDKPGNGKEKSLERRRKSSTDRRQYEEEKLIRHREIKTAINEATRQRKQNYFLRGVLVTLLLFGIIAGAWVFQPWSPVQDDVNCNAAPQAWVNWSNCLMEGARLATTDLRGARMRNANIAGGDLRGAQLGGADLAYTNLVGAKLVGTQLGQAALVGANLRNADLSDADLNGANLAYAVMQNTRLNDANLTNTDLSNADLQGADLSGVSLEGAKLDHTIWVDGRVCGIGSVGNCE